LALAATVLMPGAPAASTGATALPLAVVSTLAGSGEPGFADGPSSAATFLMPVAVAANARGNVYVADAMAQRIRELTPGGDVRTIAGGGAMLPGIPYVTQGARDGTSIEARFFNPSGIAVTDDGTLYVSDTNNGAIRRIATDGIVTTWVRNLGQPRQLAFDRGGNLYVADSDRGLLRITPDGDVSKVSVDTDSPFGVAIAPAGGQEWIFVADVRWISEIQVGGNTLIHYSRAGAIPKNPGVPLEGGQSIGTPYQIAALGAHAIAFTDPRDHCIRYLDLLHNITFVLAGAGDESASLDGAGFADGPSSASRFDDPMGIALLPDGSLVVADAGSRRIRILRGFDRREIERDPVNILSLARVPGQYRVLYVGSSNIWWATGWAHSIPGIVENMIVRDVREQVHRTATVVPLQLEGAPLNAFASSVSAIVDAHATDAVVLQLNDGTVDLKDPKWTAQTSATLRTLYTHLSKEHVPLILVTEPLVFELDPVEGAWAKTLKNAYLPADADAARDWESIASASDVPLIDLWKAFRDDLSSAHHVALFASDDEHLSAYGREVAGKTIGAALMRLHPWTKRT
jgi:hypothetical protein